MNPGKNNISRGGLGETGLGPGVARCYEIGNLSDEKSFTDTNAARSFDERDSC